MMTDRFIDIKTATLYFDPDHVLRVKFKDGTVMELEDARVQAKALMDLAENQPRLLLIDARDIFFSATPEARAYLAEHTGLKKIRKAEAFLVNTLSGKMIAKFYINSDKPGCPAEFFEEEEEALAWLEQFRDS